MFLCCNEQSSTFVVVRVTCCADFFVSDHRISGDSLLFAGMGICDIEIHTEPGLFEWLGWYQSGLPKYMTPAEFKENGFKVCQSDVPIWPVG